MVSDANSAFDVVLGRDFCSAVGIDILCSSQEVVWRLTDGTIVNTIPYRQRNFAQGSVELNQMCFELYTGQTDDFDPAFAQAVQPGQLPPDTDAIAAQQLHLTSSQRDDLATLLQKHLNIFEDKIGHYPHRKFHIELEPGAQPVHR